MDILDNKAKQSLHRSIPTGLESSEMTQLARATQIYCFVFFFIGLGYHVIGLF